MSEKPTNSIENSPEGFAPRAPARAVRRRKAALVILAAAALAVLTAIPALMLARAPQRQPQRRAAAQNALDALNTYLDDDIEPARMNQVKGLSRQQLSAWLDRVPARLGDKRELRKQLQPVLSARRFAAVEVRNAALKEGGSADIVLLGIPVQLRPQFEGSSVVVLWGEPGGGANRNAPGNGNMNGGGGTTMIDKCRYNKCFCANPNNCDCVSALRFQKRCPRNECNGASDCGAAGGGVDMFDFLSAF